MNPEHSKTKNSTSEKETEEKLDLKIIIEIFSPLFLTVLGICNQAKAATKKLG